MGWYKVYLLAYFRSVIGCHRSRSERVPWQVQSDIALGVACGMSRFSLVVMTSRAAAAHGWSRRRVQSHVLMSTAGPRPTPLVASLPSAYLASHDISETARLPYMGCRGGAVLMACLPNKQTSDW